MFGLVSVDSVEIKYPSKDTNNEYSSAAPSHRQHAILHHPVRGRERKRMEGDGRDGQEQRVRVHVPGRTPRHVGGRRSRHVSVRALPRRHHHRPHQHAHSHDEPLLRGHPGQRTPNVIMPLCYQSRIISANQSQYASLPREALCKPSMSCRINSPSVCVHRTHLALS